MPFVAVPDKNSGDVFTTAMWTTYLEGNLNAGVERPIYDSGVLGVAAGSIDIASIPATFANLRAMLFARGTQAALSVGVTVRMNNDVTAGHYLDVSGQDTDTAHSSAGDIGALNTLASVGVIAAASATAGSFSALVMDIPGYASTTGTRPFVAVSYGATSASTGGQFVRTTGGCWFLAGSAISRLTFGLSAGNFDVGSRLVLYGMGGL